MTKKTFAKESKIQEQVKKKFRYLTFDTKLLLIGKWADVASTILLLLRI